ncbi:MAG: suppressor of fused domain protein [Pirellulales bacterium]
MPIGEPWIEGATCDVFLVSPPYPFDPEFELCNLSDDHVNFLWLLPITQSEREYCKAHGVEALEVEFEKVGIEFWRPDREAVV